MTWQTVKNEVTTQINSKANGIVFYSDVTYAGV